MNRHLVRIGQTDAVTATTAARPTKEPTLTHGPITEAAITAGTEQGCTTYNCPMRINHPGDHDQISDLSPWTVPVTWTLSDQMTRSRMLQHGERIAQDLRTRFLTNLPWVFSDFDQKAGLELGQSEQALAAYADWLIAITVATQAERVVKMHADAPHYMSRPCGATEGAVTSSAEDTKCNGCVNWMFGLAECAETRFDTRGGCDLGRSKVEFLDSLGQVETRQGETGHMCGSHAKQAADKGEVTILEILVNP